MFQDPIVDEVRRNRQNYAAKFSYDFDAIVADLKKQQQRSKQKLVSISPKNAPSRKSKSSKKSLAKRVAARTA